jgi:hypothetical protein
VSGKNETFSIPQTVSNMAIKSELLERREVAVYVNALESDIIIREMLNDDFELKGLNDERIL